MRLSLLIFVIICILSIESRGIHKKESDDDNKYVENQSRHRRRSRQLPGYWPPYSDHYQREESRQYELLYRILSKLDEITHYLTSQQQQQQQQQQQYHQPQPVYLPYPYPVVQNILCNCGTGKNSTKPMIPLGFDNKNFFGDPNRNWGVVEDSDETQTYDDSDGSRPISLKPPSSLPFPSRPGQKQPPVEHGSSQAGADTTTRAPARPKVGLCHAAILSCCHLPDDRESCFTKLGCRETFKTGFACTKNSINSVISLFEDTYGPEDY